VFVYIPRAATRRWFLVVLLAVAALAVPATGSAKAKKTIVISISHQMLWAYKGDQVVLNSYVSTGRAGFDTPVGSFAVLTKLPSQTMEGIIGGEYYNVPDVPQVLYFTNSGHALHGTYWHSNFGTPMSHGCVNLPLDVAAWLYDWAPVGTRVLIVP
jgi:lipoprotein-anchoring transpeptidase ErfK/SrfK